MRAIYNIKKVQLSPITSLSAGNVPTYGTPLPLPGTVSLNMESESSADTIYADGIGYLSILGAASASGTLENFHITEDILKSIFNYVEDQNGNLLETDKTPKEFGMQFACDTDDGEEVYFTYYRCTSTMPNLNVQTSEASPTINPQSLSITANPITTADGTNVMRSFATKGDSNYATYFNAIVVPTIA